MIAAADIHRAIATEWANGGLDQLFKSYWNAAAQNQYTSLNDGEAAPGHPLPYCVFGQQAGAITLRMSGTSDCKHAIREVPWVFRVHATKIGDSSAKQVAAVLVEKILERFGGHPTHQPSQLPLTQGKIVNVQYLDDYGVRTGDDEYLWSVDYLIITDVPIAG